MQFLNFLREHQIDTQQLTEKHKKSAIQLSLLRVAVFVLIILFWFILPFGFTIKLLITLIGLLLFGLIVRRHQRSLYEQELGNTILSYCTEEEERSKGILPGGSDGVAFQNNDHPYSRDIDLFGPQSLFHHINRCSLQASEEILAAILLHPTTQRQAILRQEAIRELSSLPQWLIRFQSTLRLMAGKVKDRIRLENILSIAKPRIHPLSLALPLVVFTMLSLFFIFYYRLSLSMLLIPPVINYGIMINYQKYVMKTGIQANQLSKHIQIYFSALHTLHSSTFKSELMSELHHRIDAHSIREIKSLQNILYWLDSRANVFYAIINGYLLIDLFLIHFLHGWMSRNGKNAKRWFNAIHEAEVYGSMASYVLHHPAFVFPMLENTGNRFEAKNLGHPLISSANRVVNDFDLSGEYKVYLITGSNMSGKSTFLRTVAINTVMAWVGLPVCAAHLRLSDFEVFTGMRTQDNLTENTSSFYAELKRIKQLLELIKQSDKPILYFLDEILKGTNSTDRHSGAKGLIRQLVKTSSAGFISTHDLELATEYETDSLIKNYSFNSRLENDQLLFDYRIHEGKCETANATMLMRKMGILE